MSNWTVMSVTVARWEQSSDAQSSTCEDHPLFGIYSRIILCLCINCRRIWCIYSFCIENKCQSSLCCGNVTSGDVTPGRGPAATFFPFKIRFLFHMWGIRGTDILRSPNQKRSFRVSIPGSGRIWYLYPPPSICYTFLWRSYAQICRDEYPPPEKACRAGNTS